MKPSRVPNLRQTLAALCGLAGLASFTGCGSGYKDITGPGGGNGTATLTGHVFAGTTPVSGATLALYAAGIGGNGSAARSMLAGSATTASDGSFTLSDDYACESGSDQVYLVATGGSPGLAGGTTNHALVFVAAIGNCSQIAVSGESFVLNELTTAAAAWALAPFFHAAASLGASATNSAGIANAFRNAALLANATTGQLAALSTGQAIETAKLNTLANILHACAASDGTSACTALFTAATPPGGTAPADTLAAALNIVHNPGNNAAQLFAAAPSTAAFSPALTAAPADWTMALTVSGGGMQYPRALALDAAGNVWVVSQPGLLSGFSPQGVAISDTGFGKGVLNGSYGLAVDTTGNLWATSFFAPGGSRGSLTEFTGSSSGTPGTVIQHAGSNYVKDSSMNFPIALAATADGHLYIADYNNSTASIYTTTQAGFVLGNLGVPDLAAPVAIAADGSGGFWVANNDRDSTSVTGTVTHLSATGTVLANPDCCDTANGIALDPQGNAWVANYGAGSVSEVSAAGSTVLQNDMAGGLTEPAAIAVDAAGTVWVTNYYATTSAGTLSALAGNGSASPVGTGISPAYVSATRPGGYGLDAALSEPIALAPDFSGDLWVSSFGSAQLVMFFGLAAPTATPLLGLPAAP